MFRCRLPGLVALMQANISQSSNSKQVAVGRNHVTDLILQLQLPPTTTPSPESTQSMACSSQQISSSLEDPSMQLHGSYLTSPQSSSAGVGGIVPLVRGITRRPVDVNKLESIRNDIIRGIQMWSINKIELFSHFPGSSGSYM